MAGLLVAQLPAIRHTTFIAQASPIVNELRREIIFHTKYEIMIVEISGLPFEISFRYADCENYFLPFAAADNPKPLCSVTVTDEDLEGALPYCRPRTAPAGVELVALRRRFAAIFPQYQRCMYHGSAMCFQNRVFIFTAPSGTGKTTQAMHWLRQYPDEVSILNGDKPILQFCENGEILVHASPWQGKENFGCNQKPLPLMALVYLRQGPENRLSEMTISEAVSPLFSQFFCPDESEVLYRKNGVFLQKILQKIPVFLLENKGDPTSAALLHDALRERF